jgi:hypothetical protein
VAPPHVAIGNLMCLPAVDTRLHLSALVACNRTRKGASAGHLMRTVPMFASPAVHTRRAASAAQLREKYFGIRQFSSRDLAVQRDDHHPCWKAAHFLPCTRPPDVMRHLSRPQRRGTFGPSQCSQPAPDRRQRSTRPTDPPMRLRPPASVTQGGSQLSWNEHLSRSALRADVLS